MLAPPSLQRYRSSKMVMMTMKNVGNCGVRRTRAWHCTTMTIQYQQHQGRPFRHCNQISATNVASSSSFSTKTTEHDLTNRTSDGIDHHIRHLYDAMDTPKLPARIPTLTLTRISKLPDQLPKPIVVSTNLRDIIEQQKKHALEVWDSVLRQGSFSSPRLDAPQPLPTSISYNDFQVVRQKLLEGYVLPIFHAYTIPEELRLFHPHVFVNTGCSLTGGTHDNPNDAPIRLSCQKVVTGRCYSEDIDSYNNSNNNDKHGDIFGNTVHSPANVQWSTSRSIVPYQPTPNMDHDNQWYATTTSTKDTATISFECDYMTTFIDTETGLARRIVSDLGYLRDGWTFSNEYTHELVHLINTPAEMIGEDMEVTPLLSNFRINPDQNDPIYASYGTSLITRRLSRGIVLDCFKNLQRPSRTFAITGNRGIGKSYTLLFALQQALLYNKMCIILFLPKQQKAILCIRNQERVYAWEGTTIHDIAISSLFTNPNVFVLVDPLDADEGGTNYAIGARRLIYAASNHIEHFNKPAQVKHSYQRLQKGAKKYITDKERYLSPHTEDELRVALPYLLNVNNTTLNEAMKRTYDVGTIPKYVLNDIAYKTRKQQVEQYIQLLQSDSSEMLRLLNWNGLIGGTTSDEASSVQNTSDDSQFCTTATTNDDDKIDDTFEVDGIVVGRIGEPNQMENPKAEQLPATTLPKSPPKPGTAAFNKLGQPLPNHIDGTMILSLNAFEAIDRASPFGNATPRSSTKLIGYNGDHQVRYNHPKLTIASPLIYDTLIQHYTTESPSYIVSLWDKVGNGYHNGMKNCASDLFWKFVLHQRDKVEALPPNTSPLQKRNLLRRWKCYKLLKGTENPNHMSEWHIPIAMKGRHVLIERDKRYPLLELKEVFRTDKMTTARMVRMETHTQNIIHFAGPGRVVYQIVNDDDFTIHYHDMVKVLSYGKYLLRQQKVTPRHGSICCAPNPPPQKLEWYFVVPAAASPPSSSSSSTSGGGDPPSPTTPTTLKLWETRSPPCYELEPSRNETTEQRNERRILNRNKSEVNQCLRNNVVFYVLVMEMHNSEFSSVPPIHLVHNNDAVVDESSES